MGEKIKIYIRSKNKIYIYFNEEIYFFENQELEMALESFFEENQFEKNMKAAVILHFSYFLFGNFGESVEKSDKKENDVENLGKKSIKLEDISEIFKKKISFVNRKLVINHLENQFLDIYLDKREITKVKNCLKKYQMVISELKIDFDAVYSYYRDRTFEISQNENFDKNFENNDDFFKHQENFQNATGAVEGVQETGIIKNSNIDRNFGEIEEIDINEKSSDNWGFFDNGVKSGNKGDRIEILQIGEENSLRILIEDEKIAEVEKIELKIEDVDDAENFDFGDMTVVGSGENDVKVIFVGADFSDGPDFVKKTAIFDKESVKNVKFSDVVIAGICIIAYFGLYNSIPLQKKTVENEIIQKEIKSLEKDYLNRKAEEIPDYSKELVTLREIDGAIKRREYYSVIKFLVENSKNGIDYTKINYENAKWTVQGEMENFNNFERFENNILRKYPSSELGYLKDNDTATVFEYVVESF
ncbi:hypothetical protein JMUB3935_1935 [Leptotrichia trevisanii]|uniref:Uncharacterized protein n=1 Tax=Leptotrichia trevisanii TaxID=109328 RepID=A0A510KT79_9FUSO|nr:hypothetical protein [Leptotrichia trevisanii]BBM52955.1 hypothetical protein JMUB3935_1935 [Leptotrichia trevisanii]